MLEMKYLMYLWSFFDLAGTAAFAVSGVLVGIPRRMDVFGCLVLALSTAIGGGIIRDVLVGNFPPMSLRTWQYVTLTMVITFIIFIVYRFRRLSSRSSRQKFKKLYLAADTVGLASFTVTGTSIGYSAYPEYPIFAVLLGLITAVGGGMIRDVLAQRIPSVLTEEIYALPAIIGGAAYYILMETGFWYMAALASFATVVIIRWLGIHYHINLPKMHR